jgi:outer membrane protein assembly factor BamB
VSWRFLLLIAAALSTSGCEWLKMSSKDGVEPPTELTDLTPTVSVTRQWERNVGDGAGRAGLKLSPAFDGERLYVSDSERGVLALNAGSGAIIWSNAEAGGVSSSPGVDRDLVVAGTLEGDVIAMTPSDGATRWKVRVTSEVIARPAVSGTMVVVRSNDGRVFGLDPSDGTRRWVFDRSVPLLSLRGNAAPIISGSTVLVPFDSGRLFALDLAEGTLLWEQSIAQPEGKTELERMVDMDGLAQIDDGRAFVATFRGQVASVDLGSGRALWTRDVSAFAGVAKSGDTLVLTDASGTVMALEARDGSSLWSQKALAHRYLSAPVVVGQYVAVGDLEGWVHFLGLGDGQLAARVRLGKDPLRGEPLVSGDTVFFQSTDGRVGAWRVGG